MGYYFSKRLETSFDDAVHRVSDALQREGFGVLTDIDVTEVMNKKLGLQMRPYRILGACNPHFAHKALEVESKIGTMLPCNVIVQEIESGVVEIAAVDPIASMQAVTNPALAGVAGQVQVKLKSLIESL